MANKKISELQSRTPALSDLMLVGDPSSGYSYKCTVTALATIIETDIADGYVTIGTTQTISGAKTFSNNLTLTSVVNTPTDPDKFLTLNASNVVTYRTGAEVLSDIGGASASSISGTTNYVAKFTSSSAIGNSAIYSNTSGNVSIGNTNDAYKLDVSGTVRSTSNFVVNNGTVVGNYAIETAQVQIGTFSNHPFVLTTFNTERVRIDTSGNVTFSQIANATTDTDKFLVSDSGVLKYRTGAEVLSDIGAASSSSISGTTNYLAKFTSSSAVGNSQIFDNGTNVGIGTNTPTRTLDVNGIITTNNNLELTSANPTILWTTSNLRFYNNTNGVVATISSAGQLSLSSIPNATTDTDKFLVSDGGVVKYRTGSEVLSDIGAASSSSISGTTNYIPKFTSSSAIGNSILYDYSTGVAIGNAGSGLGYAIEISTNATAPRIDLVDNSTYTGQVRSNAGIFYLTNNSNNPIVFSTNGSERMRLTSGGLLGLGTSSPNARLQVSNSSSDGIIISTTANVEPFLAIWRNSASNGVGVLRLLDGGNIAFDNGATGAAQSTKMTLTASGSLGIGTSAPDRKLVIQGTFNSNEQLLYLKQGDNNGFSFNLDAAVTGNLMIKGVNSGTETSSLLTIRRDNGNIGISTSSPTQKLDVAGAIKTSNGGSENIIVDDGVTSTGLQQSSNAFYINSNSSSATNGSIIFRSSSAYTERMRLDASGNLGLGTSSPSYKLSLNTGVAGVLANFTDGVAQTLRISTGSGFVALDNPSAGAIAFQIASSERMRLDASGNLGLGVTPSAWGSGYTAFQIGTTGQFVYVTNSLFNINNAYYNGTNWIYQTNGYSNVYEINKGDGAHKWYTAPLGTAGNAISFTQAMTLDASGRLGIGATSPGYRLEVNGDIGFSGGASLKWGGNTYIYGSNNVQLEARVNGNLGWYINSSGNVGISTTNPQQKLHIAGDVQIGESSGGEKLRFVGASNKYNFQLGKQINGDNIFEITPSTAAGGTTFSTPAFVVTYDSKIGIGTTNPAEILELSTTTDPKIRFVDVGNLDAKVGIVGSTALGFEVNGSERMRITSGGNVGIGLSSPQTITSGARVLQVDGSSYGIALASSGSVIAQMIGDGFNSTVTIGSRSNHPYSFTTNDTERMRLTTSGELLINTTSDAGDYKLQVNGNSYTSGILQINGGGTFTTTSYGLSLYGQGYEYKIGFDSQGGTKGYIRHNIVNGGANDTWGHIFSTSASGTPNTFTNLMFVGASGNVEIPNGSIKTAAPSGGTAQPWKLGSKVTQGGILSLDVSNYIEVEINGTFWKLGIVN